MYKVKHFLAPPVFQKIFTEVSTIHDHNTRQRQHFYVHSFRTNVGKFSITSHGPQVWKTMPNYIHNATSILLFKKRLKLYIVDDQ